MEKTRNPSASKVAALPANWRVAERPASYIVDASIVLKWFIQEQDSSLADVIKERYGKKDIHLLAPSLLWYEVGHVLRRTYGDDLEAMNHALEDFSDLAIELRPPSLSLLKGAVELAHRYRLSVYDANYFALGSIWGIPVVTADKEFHAHVGDPYRVMSIEEWATLYQ